MRYVSADEVNKVNLARWLSKSREIQWDYKNIVRRKGKLERASNRPEGVTIAKHAGKNGHNHTSIFMEKNETRVIV